MTHLHALPWWIALPAALFLVIGSTLTALGALGLVRLSSFYDRLHAPTLGTSWGAAGILIASMMLFSWIGGRVVIHELVIGVFIMLTTPVTLMLLGRAALYRDRLENSPAIPTSMHVSPAEPVEDIDDVLDADDVPATPETAAEPAAPKA